MKHVFDFETTTIAITGTYPLINNDRVANYLLAKVNGAQEDLVEAGKALAMAPMGRDQFVAALVELLDGNKPQNSWLVDTVASALDNIYDRTDVTNVLSRFEEDSFVEYVAWLKGGYTTLEGDVVPFVKPDEDGLAVAATAIEKMINARA